jgi:hypothetical protein
MKNTLHILKTLPMLMVVFGCAAVTMMFPEFSDDARKRSKVKVVSAEDSAQWERSEKSM